MKKMQWVTRVYEPMLRNEAVRIGRNLTLNESCEVIERYIECHTELTKKLCSINGIEYDHDEHLEFLKEILSDYRYLAENGTQ